MTMHFKKGIGTEGILKNEMLAGTNIFYFLFFHDTHARLLLINKIFALALE